MVDISASLQKPRTQRQPSFGPWCRHVSQTLTLPRISIKLSADPTQTNGRKQSYQSFLLSRNAKRGARLAAPKCRLEHHRSVPSGFFKLKKMPSEMSLGTRLASSRAVMLRSSAGTTGRLTPLLHPLPRFAFFSHLQQQHASPYHSMISKLLSFMVSFLRIDASTYISRTVWNSLVHMCRTTPSYNIAKPFMDFVKPHVSSTYT